MKPGLKRLLAVSVVLLPALALGAAAPAKKAPAKPPAKAPSPAPAASGVKFTDITAASGVKFTHNSGRSGKKYLPESLGSGVALFDADGDGWLDILLINSRDWDP